MIITIAIISIVLAIALFVNIIYMKKLALHWKIIISIVLGVFFVLLVLIISKEVLNSFFQVNQGITRTTRSFDNKNAETYQAFERAAKHNPEKYQKIRDKARHIHKEADEIVMYIQEMKYDLVSKCDGEEVFLGTAIALLNEDGDPKEDMAINETAFNKLTPQQKSMPIGWLDNKSDRSASGELFFPNDDEGTRASILKKKITNYKNILTKMSNGNKSLVANINLVCDVSDKKRTGEDEAWEEYNFVDMPSVGALTILSKIQSDLRNLEADLINYLKRHIEEKLLKFGGAEGIAIPTTNFVLRGDSFRAEVFITAKNPGQDPDIYVGEYDSLGGDRYEMKGEYETLKVINGKGIFATRTSLEGVKKWGGLIAMKTETGTKFYPFKGEYLVASKQAVASPTNMNVLYVAVDNPIKIAVAGYSASQVSATTRNGTIKSVNKNNGEWSVNPNVQNNENSPIIDLFVTVDGKRKNMGTVEFKVKDVPTPTPKAAGIGKKVVSRGDLRAAQMLIAEMKNFYFDRNAVSYRIVSYDISYVNTKGQFRKEIKGYKFDEKVITAINNTKVGGSITFSNITVRRPGVKGTKTLEADLMYTIK